MKGAVETMIGMILIAFMSVLSAAYITASLNTQSAQNYHSTIIAELEAGDFSEIVVQNCREKAIENGYEDLEIKLMNGEKEKKYAKVTLTYSYTMPILDLLLEHQITGYAR